MFTKLEIVSRWIIFTIDICLSLFALLFAVILQHNFIIDKINFVAFYKSVLLVIAVNSLVFYSVKTFAGIVRYTSAQDSFRILFSVILSSLALFFINALIIVVSGVPVVSNVAIVIYTLFSFLMLITYRIIVKYFFMYLKNAKLDKIRVIIYGAGEAGVATKRTFDHDAKVNKTIIAFVDDDLRKVGKTIDGVKILDASQLEHLIIKHEVDEIIFASYTIPSDRKNQVVDVCLENNVKILNIPSPDVWARGQVTTAQIQNLNIEDLLNRKTIQIDIDGIQSQLKDKRILITGAAGSIGSEIVRQLLKFETGLIILCDQSETALHNIYLELEESHANTNFHAFIGDVKDEKRMEFLFETYKPHYVYHAAAYKHVPLMEDNPAEAIKTNVMGTKTIADKSVKHGVQKFVMISTDKAVNPTNVMGASKRIAEIYVQSLNNSLHNTQHVFSNGLSYINDLNVKPITKFITTRFGNVLGSNGSVIPRFKQQIEKGGPVTVTHPEITRYFMTIPEACRLVLEAGCMGKGGEIFVFDMGKSVKIVELAKKMIRLAGLVPNEDIKISYSGLRPGEKLFEELLNDNENTMPTHHEKIMIGQVREYDFNDVQEQLVKLLKYALTDHVTKVVQQMKVIVPEFKSKNSIFEELDVARQENSATPHT
ncbi:NDP-sugar epimerase, includes UDP-GlcNAc-inverting 4,6-dehydratase FlaA1 and capsular polysaccharide biosynthesis protein EpsC [Pedobacter steynii]|uniref:NDP-sugar epimerase, includes UDP-GlcNAc-inverting 4,6-dehydratase FlaA1 and capsular polysaccharide biosynthesis protein EpsC n=1 Tax=Pedobacter steynii TaxID=430522 RepID=A0A1G9WJP2_9SPHI|nr:nucleoside-diphosphate sugar epimerase/dehydratase [Pedobacter steynii]NQX40317.1 polysaccharide biosynthesis protein [Pedobacter steynii]SDM84710.1 NDP-sugar epimerase, includes UDP-GlcNAc-inverting 4,6-dehydratase FlaA1 and capsular polysaccharide biosynthesis protein EpsC [Pedobacter steynii]